MDVSHFVNTWKRLWIVAICIQIETDQPDNHCIFANGRLITQTVRITQSKKLFTFRAHNWHFPHNKWSEAQWMFFGCYFWNLGICVKIFCKDIQKISVNSYSCVRLSESRVNVNNMRRKTTPLETDHFDAIEQCRKDENNVHSKNHVELDCKSLERWFHSIRYGHMCAYFDVPRNVHFFLKSRWKWMFTFFASFRLIVLLILTTV